MQQVEPVAFGATAGLVRLLTRHARASWIELRTLRGRAEDGVLQLLADVASSPLLRLLQLDRRVAALCIGWLSDDSAAVVLGREVEPGFRQPELELLRLALPVLTLADAQAADLADSLGARLSPREEEISRTSSVATATGRSPWSWGPLPSRSGTSWPACSGRWGSPRAPSWWGWRQPASAPAAADRRPRRVVRRHHSRGGSAAILRSRPSGTAQFPLIRREEGCS